MHLMHTFSASLRPASNSLFLSGLFWWRNGNTDTLAGARAADALLYSIIAFTSLRVSHRPLLSLSIYISTALLLKIES